MLDFFSFFTESLQNVYIFGFYTVYRSVWWLFHVNLPYISGDINYFRFEARPEYLVAWPRDCNPALWFVERVKVYYNLGHRIVTLKAKITWKSQISFSNYDIKKMWIILYKVHWVWICGILLMEMFNSISLLVISPKEQIPCFKIKILSQPTGNQVNKRNLYISAQWYTHNCWSPWQRMNWQPTRNGNIDTRTMLPQFHIVMLLCFNGTIHVYIVQVILFITWQVHTSLY
jgi:hypothetical protein